MLMHQKNLKSGILHGKIVAEPSACSKSFPNLGFRECLRLPDCFASQTELQNVTHGSHGCIRVKKRPKAEIFVIFYEGKSTFDYLHQIFDKLQLCSESICAPPDEQQQLEHEKTIFYPCRSSMDTKFASLHNSDTAVNR